MDTFITARSDVVPHLFPDVLPALEALRAAGLKVGAITNGNCDVGRSLAAAFPIDFAVTAADAGAAKPDAPPFLQAAAAAGCHPQAIVHVGDSAVSDLAGALEFGMRAILLTRPELKPRSPEEAAAVPPADAARWRELASMDAAVETILRDAVFRGTETSAL